MTDTPVTGRNRKLDFRRDRAPFSMDASVLEAFNDLFHMDDTARQLYAAKDAGRNCARVPG